MAGWTDDGEGASTTVVAAGGTEAGEAAPATVVAAGSEVGWIVTVGTGMDQTLVVPGAAAVLVMVGIATGVAVAVAG